MADYIYNVFKGGSWLAHCPCLLIDWRGGVQGLLSDSTCRYCSETFVLTLSTLYNFIPMLENSADPDKSSRNESSHQDLHCSQVIFGSISAKSVIK